MVQKLKFSKKNKPNFCGLGHHDISNFSERIDPDDEEEDIDELDESDNLRFDCQLAAIGLLSRISIPQSMPQLQLLTLNKVNTIAGCLQKQESVPVSLWEDLHWLYLSIGHMIADETDSGETRYIPNEIMKSSVAQKSPPVAIGMDLKLFFFQKSQKKFPKICQRSKFWARITLPSRRPKLRKNA